MFHCFRCEVIILKILTSENFLVETIADEQIRSTNFFNRNVWISHIFKSFLLEIIPVFGTVLIFFNLFYSIAGNFNTNVTSIKSFQQRKYIEDIVRTASKAYLNTTI